MLFGMWPLSLSSVATLTTLVVVFSWFAYVMSTNRIQHNIKQNLWLIVSLVSYIRESARQNIAIMKSYLYFTILCAIALCEKDVSAYSHMPRAPMAPRSVGVSVLKLAVDIPGIDTRVLSDPDSST